MTNLGKILVIVNFVFSLVTSALILMVFAVRTNWSTSYDQLKKKYEVSQANVRAHAEEVNEIKTKVDVELKKLNNKLVQVERERDDAFAKVLLKDDEVKKARESSKLATVTADSSIAELDRRREELKQLQDTVKKRDQQVVELELQKKELLDKYVRTNQKANTLQLRLEQVETALQAARGNPAQQQAGAPNAGGFHPLKPPEDVKGIILDTDPKNGFVTLSIGSDAGISKWNVLEVYRLKPEPKYLGQVKIIEVTPHKSVGRPIMAQRALSIQKGDTVASDIMGQR